MYSMVSAIGILVNSNLVLHWTYFLSNFCPKFLFVLRYVTLSKFETYHSANKNAHLKCCSSISNHLRSLYTCNKYIISNTQNFSKHIQQQSPIQLEEECVPNNIKLLFTNFFTSEIIEYALNEIYVHNKLPTLGSRLILNRIHLTN